MADVNANIGVNIDASNALAQLKSLQRQLSQFHTSVAKSSSAAASAQASFQKNLVNSINATGAFSAELRTVRTTSEAFTNSLEKNKFSMREYFRYAGAATKTFGKTFQSEFDTIGKVAEDRVKKLQTQYIKLGRDTNGAMKAIAVIPNQLDLSNHSTQLQLAAQKQAIFNQLLKQGSTNLLNFGKNTQWAGRQLMVGFTLPLASLGMVASKSFMDMENAALKFRKVYGDLLTPQSETQQALENIQELAQEFTKYGVAVSQTVGLAAEAAAAGFQGLDLQRQTIQATRLSILGQIESQQALDTTIALQNAFKMSSEDLADSINFLNAVENQTVLSLDDVTTAIPKVAPVIQQLGGDVKDLAFFMTAMKQGGINASEGANALKSGLASLINPTNTASKMLASMGINIKSIVESNQGDLKSTVIDFALALDKLDPLSRARAIEQMFGKFQFARLSALFSNVIADGTQASRVLDLAGTSIEDLAALSESELAISAGSAMNKFKKAVEDLKFALVPVGEAFLQAVTPILEFFENILEKFAGLSDNTKKIITVLTIAIGGIGPVALMAFGLLANGLANIIKLFATLRNGYLRLTGQSAVLGEQTQYMTTEQLDAAAAAHSLNQSHANLTQTFTAESGAVRQLIAAYTDATRAASQFAMSNPGMMLPGRGRAPKKFAIGGIFKGPGTGKSDSIPAMVSNGEAIIPAETVKKYPGMVAGLIAGNVPGYKGGLEPLAKGFKNATMYLPESINTAMGGSGKGVPTSDVTQYLSKAGGSSMAPLMAVMAKQMGASLNSPQFQQEWAKVGLQFSNAAVEALNNSGKQFIKDEDLEEIVVPALKKTAKNLNVVGKEIATSLDKTVSEIHTVGQVGTQSGAKGGAGRTALSRFSYRNARANAQTFALEQNPEMFSRVDRLSSSGKMKKSFQTLNPATKNFEVATMAHITKSITTTVNDLIKRTAPYLGDMGAKITKATAKSMSDGAKEALKISSPSKETKKIGVEAGIGLAEGIKESIPKAKAAGKQIADSIVSGVKQSSKQGIGTNAPVGTAFLPIVSPPTEQDLKKTRRRDRFRSAKGNIAGSMSGGRGMGISSGAMIASQFLPGKAGQIAGQASGLLFAVQALTMLPGPLKIAAAVLLTGVGVYKLFSAATERARLKIEGLGDVATMSKEKLATLGSFFGVTTRTLSREKRKPGSTAAPIGATQRSAVDSLRQTEDFQKTFKNDINALKTATVSDATMIFQSLAIQLKGRGFASEQIKTIIQALQEEAGKTSIKLDFKNIGVATEQKIIQQAKFISQTLFKAFSAEGFDKELVPGQQVKIASDKLNAQLDAAGSAMSAILDGLIGQFEGGEISVIQFNSRINDLSQEILDIPKPVQVELLAGMFRNLGPEARRAAYGIKGTNDQLKVLLALSSGIISADNPIIKVLATATDSKTLGRAQNQLSKIVRSFYKLFDLNTNNDTATPINDTIVATDGLSKASEAYLKILDAEITALEKKRDANKESNNEMQRQIDLQIKMQDLSNQMKIAQISGNYLGASLLSQQQRKTALEFNQETKDIQAQKVIDKMKERASAIKDGAPLTPQEKAKLNKNKSSIKVPKLHSWNGPVPGKYGQELPAVLKSGTEGVYQEGYMNDLKRAASSTTNSASSVYNVNMTINGGNSSPKEIAEEVMKKMQVVANKNNKTNAGLR